MIGNIESYRYVTKTAQNAEQKPKQSGLLPGLQLLSRRGSRYPRRDERQSWEQARKRSLEV